MKQTLEQVVREGRTKTALGKVATYIPELGKADPAHLGVCVYTRSGQRLCAGDTDVRFTIQSISKLITLAVALERCGFDKVFQNVGMEPSGDAFNSLIKLENTDSTPHNPMINAGAIVVANLLCAHATFEDMLQASRTLCMDEEITLDQSVYESEMANLSRNRAIAYLLDSKGYMENDVERSLDFYVRMCALSVTARSLAGFGLILSNDGIHPGTGERLLKAQTVRVVKTIMLMCGMYDGSGEFAVRVGMPCKSGVGGGIISVADGRMGIGIFAPALDAKGNSVAGEHVLETLSRKWHLHMFDSYAL